MLVQQESRCTSQWHKGWVAGSDQAETTMGTVSRCVRSFTGLPSRHCCRSPNFPLWGKSEPWSWNHFWGNRESTKKHHLTWPNPKKIKQPNGRQTNRGTEGLGAARAGSQSDLPGWGQTGTGQTMSKQELNNTISAKRSSRWADFLHAAGDQRLFRKQRQIQFNIVN